MAGRKRKRTRLTDSGIARLRPREREYTVWDSRLEGLGVRVRPTGGRSYILFRKTRGLWRRVSLGPVSARSVDDVRREYRMEGQETGSRKKTAAPKVPLFRDFVSGAWKEVHFDNYKPSTRRRARITLERHLGPVFGSKRLDRITPTAVRRWFDRYSRKAPGGANHVLGTLRQIMNFAIACGHVEANPTRHIRLNRRPRLTRFLSREEIGRLHKALDENDRKCGGPQADIIRLLLLTGCRKSEIVQLRWSEIDDDMLVLADSKTGPRKVPLNRPARLILERQPWDGSGFVFPSPEDPGRPRGSELGLWYRIRREAGIVDVRLHDLRHTYASHAVMNGVPVPVVSRLLGHSNVSMTLRYAHLADREVEAAAERVGQALGTVMGLDCLGPSGLSANDVPCDESTAALPSGETGSAELSGGQPSL